MGIVLLNLPWQENERLGVRAGSRWPFTSLPEHDGHIHYFPFPFFLAYATSLLKKNGKQAELLDAIAEEINADEVIKRIRILNPGLIVIEISTPSFKNDIRLIHMIHSSLPYSQIALCGPHASVFPRGILNKYDFIKYILIGEYEFILLELVDSLENNLIFESIRGLAYREGQEIKINELRPTVDDLNKLPWPEREGIPIYKYNDGFAGLPLPNVQMWSSRGCPFKCIFCLWPQTIYNEHKYRMRNPKDVVNEMEYLIRRYNFKAIYFDDDVFNVSKKHTVSICEEIRRRKINVPWAAMARADLMDEKLLGILSKAGLYAVKYGIESANKDLLKFCQKDMDLDKVYKIIKITKVVGIKVHLTFCLGLPGENKNTIHDTINFIENTKPDSLQFSFATPFPGTAYYEYAKNHNLLLSKDWGDYDGSRKCVIKLQDLNEQVLDEIKVALSGRYYI